MSGWQVGGDGFLVKRRAPVRVRAEWMRLCPGRSLRFWGIVARRVRERRIRHSDWVRVREVCQQVERELGPEKGER